LKPDGFFKIEEEQISAINHQIGQLQNCDRYLELQQKMERETASSQQALSEARKVLKAALPHKLPEKAAKYPVCPLEVRTINTPNIFPLHFAKTNGGKLKYNKISSFEELLKIVTQESV